MLVQAIRYSFMFTKSPQPHHFEMETRSKQLLHTHKIQNPSLAKLSDPHICHMLQPFMLIKSVFIQVSNQSLMKPHLNPLPE